MESVLSLAHISFRKFILLVYTLISSFWSYKQVKAEISVSSSDDDDDIEDGSEDNQADSSDDSHKFLSNKTISRYYTLFR